ncbi:MAG: transporter substrate-binding domain-containing protein [Chloroflexota bacterium]
MRKIVLLITLFVMGLMTTVTMAQEPNTFCVTELEAIVTAVADTCGDMEVDRICYGNAVVNAVPRVLTAEFDFDEPGERLDIPQMETMTTEVGSTRDYGMAVARLSAGLEDGVVEVVLYGNTFVANNVLPEIELAFTTNTLTALRTEPSADAEVVVELVPGDSLTASGRIGPNDTITGETWVRAIWDDSGDEGWIPAGELTEDFLLLSLPVVLAEDPTFSPMQALTTTSVLADRGCEAVPDSGLLLQTPDASINMRFNSLDVELEPTSTVYLQAQPNAILDVYVLAGAVDTGGEVIEAGTVMSYSVGPDALTTGRAIEEPLPYPNEKVQPLQLLAGLFSAEVDITPGTGDAVEASVASIVPELADEQSTELTTDEDPLEAIEEAPAAPVVDVEATAAAIAEALDNDSVAQLPTAVAQVAEPAPAEAAQSLTAQIATPPPVGDTNIATSPFAGTLRERGVVRIGVNGNLPTFSEEAGGDYAGFEPNFARELVRRLFGDTVQIEWVQVSARQRSTVLADGTVDMLIRNTSFAPERSTWGEWTDQFYFVDGQRFLVRADSGITGDGDLTGRAIAVQAGTNAETTLNAFAAQTGITVVPLQGTLLELIGDLESGFVDGISADWTALEAIRVASENPDNFVVVGDLLTSIPWNIATPPGEVGLSDDIEFALNVMIEDGTWLALYDLSFDPPIPATAAAALAPGTDVAVVEAPPIAAEEVEPAPAEEVAAPPPAEEEPVVAAPPALTPVPETDLPITGEVPATIFTNPSQQRIIRITPEDDGSFTMELIRQGLVVHDSRFVFSERSERYENRFNSFEYVEFSDSAGDASQGCDRPPDMTGVFNGAPFEVKVGC